MGIALKGACNTIKFQTQNMDTHTHTHLRKIEWISSLKHSVERVVYHVFCAALCRMQFAVISLRDKDLDFGKSAGRLKEECGSRILNYLVSSKLFSIHSLRIFLQGPNIYKKYFVVDEPNISKIFLWRWTKYLPKFPFSGEARPRHIAHQRLPPVTLSLFSTVQGGLKAIYRKYHRNWTPIFFIWSINFGIS